MKITIGIDFAAQSENTAACLIAWERGRAEVQSVVQPADDRALVVLAKKAHKVGVDVPLGWPDEFVKAVVLHRRGNAWPSIARDKLCYRKSDQFIHEKIGRWPLSVSTDRIGITAFRAARLAPQLAGTEGIDRTGQGKLVEVYPVAALRRWGLAPTNKNATQALFIALRSRTSEWLRIPEDSRPVFNTSRDAFDALIAALIARAAAIGLCEPIPSDALPQATREGWIALPFADSLGKLAIPDT